MEVIVLFLYFATTEYRINQRFTGCVGVRIGGEGKLWGPWGYPMEATYCLGGLVQAGLHSGDYRVMHPQWGL